jgi:ParB family chromosome partitioning protein
MTSFAKINVRKHGPKEVDSLAASIAAKGLLQPLLVRPMGDKFEVVFGGRRTLALRKLNALDTPDTDNVPCIVSAMDDATAIAASLAENIERLPMDLLDQYDAFAALVKGGWSEDDIASHFGVTVQVVKRRLAIARLVPELKKLYREGDLEDGELHLLTMAPKDKQRAYLKAASEGNPPQHWQLKEWLLGGKELATTVALFALDAYKGGIATDLFGEVSYFLDQDEFWRLQNAALAAAKAELEANGWPAEIIEPSARFQHWLYARRAKDKGGRAIIVVTPDGKVETHRGLVHHDELAKTAKGKGKAKGYAKGLDADADGDEAVSADVVQRPELSEPLSNYVELVRHSAVRAALTEAPKVALRVAVAQLIAGSTHWKITTERRSPAAQSIGEALAKLATEATIESAQDAAHKLLGKKVQAEDHMGEGMVVSHGYNTERTLTVYARLIDLSDAEVMGLLAVVVAESLAVGTGIVDVLGTQLKVDVLKGWQPDDTLFQLIRDKEALGAMLAEVAASRRPKPT